MKPDSVYLRLGKMVEDMHIDYYRAIDKHKELIRLRNEIDEAITVEENRIEKNMDVLGKLYQRLRCVRADLVANRSYRQHLFDKFNTEVDEVLHPSEWTKNEQAE